MKPLSTTYRYDYVPPLTGFKLMKALKDQQAYDCQLFCKAQQNIPKPSIPKPKDSEWTGICPMGLLTDPRLIPFESPTADSTDEFTNIIKKGKCVADKRSEFLDMVRTCYPHIYERWCNASKYKRQMDIARNKTIYQMDYIPKSMEKTTFDNTIPKYHVLNNIMEETVPPDCLEHYQPFNINFSSPSHFSRHEYIYGPYFLNPINTKTSEYMDKIGRTACIITKNTIHNHQNKCKTSCLHKLSHTCN